MILFKKAIQIGEYCKKQKASKKKVGFVPTMGALHPGHISLLEYSKRSNEITICSIFVNPTQFNDPKDFRKYPVTIEQDIYLLERSGINALFLPDVSEIYPNGATQVKKYEFGSLENSLEGKYRPGHFQGVGQVMNRLLDIVQPDNLYMGQKDYQQCMIVNRLLEIMHSDIVLHTCPTLREEDGLAMSSRNSLLSAADRKKANTIFAVLKYLKDNIQAGGLDQLKKPAYTMLEQNGLKPDYAEITDAVTLDKVSSWDGKQKLVALIAAFLGEVRLIDNMTLSS